MKGILLADRYFTLPGVIFYCSRRNFCRCSGTLSPPAYQMDILVNRHDSISGLAFAFKVALPAKKNLPGHIEQGNIG